MEGNNFLTAGDLALIENYRNPNRGYGYDPYCNGHYKNGTATTGVGLAAGLGGGALLLAIAAAWGVNQASKARAKAAEQTTALLDSNLSRMSNLLVAENQNREAAVLAERQSRETWQNYHAPSTTQYVDIRTNSLAGAGASSSALAQAEATLLSGALTGQFARCPQEVTLVAKQNCPCPGSCG